MQGIYQGHPAMLYDKIWTVVLTLLKDNNGLTHFDRAIELVKHSGQAIVLRN
jgi:hypothetical protein